MLVAIYISEGQRSFIILVRFVILSLISQQEQSADRTFAVNNEMANRMSLFYAEATPMLKVLSDSTTKFVTEVSRWCLFSCTRFLQSIDEVTFCLQNCGAVTYSAWWYAHSSCFGLDVTSLVTSSH